jgi:hypothetical protein
MPRTSTIYAPIKGCKLLLLCKVPLTSPPCDLCMFSLMLRFTS